MPILVASHLVVMERHVGGDYLRDQKGDTHDHQQLGVDQRQHAERSRSETKYTSRSDRGDASMFDQKYNKRNGIYPSPSS